MGIQNDEIAVKGIQNDRMKGMLIYLMGQSIECQGGGGTLA